MNKENIQHLYNKHKSKALSDSERLEWDAVIADDGQKPLLIDSIDSDWGKLNMDNLSHMNPVRSKDILSFILAQKQYKSSFGLWSKIAVAAAIATIIFGAVLFYTNSDKHISEKTVVVNDLPPGKNAATITLANGKTIVLSTTQKGVTIGERIITYGNGSKIGYTDAIQQLLAVTPKGGTYQFTLPDGTRVWLNAASSLKFPSSFKDKRLREVELTGEAYFEVARNKAHPFIITTGEQQVEVLGTHFNINAYDDEAAVKTTLLEGSVKVSLRSKADEIILSPGQQSVLSNHSLDVKPVEVSDAIDWKNGEFAFNNETLESILRKVARWYDVEIIYQGGNKRKSFWGSVSRYDRISKVLEKIELTGDVKFRLEGRRVYVIN